MSPVSSRALLTYVFVYGTLKRGQPNHHWLTADPAEADHGTATLVGTGRTLRKYPLIVGTRYNIPFLLDQPGTGHLLHGEVYAIDAAKLAHLDVLEDYPSFYGREQQQIELLTRVADNGGDGSQDSSDDSPTTLNCWVYLLQTFPDAMLAKPMLESYADTVEKPYQIRSVRLTDLRAADDLAY